MSNFFELYARYTDGSEPPPNFHAWSAIAAISALLGKKCQVSQGHYTVFPHLYIVLVGEPGTKKTTAAKIARRLVQLVENIPIAPESASREALIDFMASNSSKIDVDPGQPYWQASSFGAELDQFLGGKHVNQAMVGFLNSIWDEAIFVEQTRKSGKVTIHNPYFTLLGCCTPSWVTDKLKEGVFTGGWARRVIFQLEKDRACLNPRPRTTPDKIEALTLLASEVRRIHEMKGPFEMSDAACAEFDRLYIHHNDNKTLAKFSEKIQTYFTSRHDLLYKVAMCLSAGINSTRHISVEIIRAADSFLLQSERCLETVFAGIGRNELKAEADKALNGIRNYGPTGITKPQFVKDNYANLNKQELDEIWETLATTGAVTALPLDPALGGPRVRAAVLDPLPPAANLLHLVRHLKLHQERRSVESPAFVVARHLAPETERLLVSLAERKAQLAAGILLKGTPSPSVDEQVGPSEKQAESPSPQTPQSDEQQMKP